ncbi:MAG: hypothetical protein WCK35_24885 [Chloroflexota bacterium]
MSPYKKNFNRRDFLKLSGGALGLSALSFYAGYASQPQPFALTNSVAYVDDLSPLPVFRAPYLQHQVQMAAFLFGADLDQLTLLCDRYLNIPTQGQLKYVPLMANLVLTYSDMLISSLDERDAGVGSLRETEIAFWIPTMAMRKVGGTYVPQHLAWFLPTLFVDDSCAIASGREVYGFNKQWGKFERPDLIEDPHLSASVMGFSHFGPDVVGSLQPLLQLRKSQTQPMQPTQPANNWTDWESARKELSANLLQSAQANPAAPLVEIAARLATEPMPLVFLKQFRDAVDSRQACYQAIVQAHMHVTDFKSGGFLPARYELELNQLESHPLNKNLGLPSGSQPASLGVWMQLSFNLGQAEEVYRAG